MREERGKRKIGTQKPKERSSGGGEVRNSGWREGEEEREEKREEEREEEGEEGEKQGTA